MRQNRKSRLFRPHEVGGFAVLTCVACISLAALAVWLDLSTAQKDFDARSANFQRSLAHQFGNTDTILTSLAGLHHSSDRLDDYEFAGQARELLHAYPFVSAIVEADVLTPDERAQFEEHMRDNGFYQFRLHTLDGEDDDAAGENRVSLPIAVIEPFGPVEASLVGLDLFSDSRLADAAAMAITSGQVATSEAIELPNVGRSLFIFKAFYFGHTLPDTLEQRNAQASGVIALVLEPHRFFERLVREYSDLEFSFTAIRHGIVDFENPLFAHRPAQVSRKLPFIGPFVSEIPLTGNNSAFVLRMRSYPTLSQIRLWFVALMVVVGAVGCGFLGFAIWTRRVGQQRIQADERILRANEQRFRDYAEIASDWFWSTDSELRFDYTSGDPTGRSARQLQALLTGVASVEGVRIDTDVADELFSALKQRRRFRDIRYSYTDRQGQAKWWAISGKPVFDGENRFCGYRGTGRDVTAETEARLALVKSKEEADIANRSKSEFVANMSHELRTPLNAIIGFSEILQSQALGPLGSDRYLAYARDICNSGRHLLSLINDILDLSKVESGVDELLEEEIDVADVVCALVVLVRPHAEKGNVDLVLDIQDALPALLADERKIKQILVNILSNAIKFTRAGGRVSLCVRHSEDGAFEFRTLDNGIGMTPAEVRQALLKFGQIDSDLNRKYDGTGLGLPLSKALIELHGGVLEIESEKGMGTTVTVRLPAFRTVAGEPAAPGRRRMPIGPDPAAEDDETKGPASPHAA